MSQALGFGGCEIAKTSAILIAISSSSAPSVVVDLWTTWISTHRAQVHEARESDNPEVCSIDHVAAIELEDPGLDTWMNERGTKQKPTKSPSPSQLVT